MLTVLQRYLLRQNLFYLFIILSIGVGVYLLVDLFENLDDFVESGVGLQITFMFFIYKIPLIVSQILPAVFLLSVLIQLGTMRLGMEIIALESCSIAFIHILKFFIIYSMFFACIQLTFSEFFGVWGNEHSEFIWHEQVKKKKLYGRSFHNIWFKAQNNFIHLEQITPIEGQGQGVCVYEMGKEGDIQKIISARSFHAEPGKWELFEVREVKPANFAMNDMENMILEIKTDPKSFLAIDPKSDPALLPALQLHKVLKSLQKSGSNVERLQTALHGRLAYAFSGVIMTLLALAVVTCLRNIYAILASGLILTFVYYGCFVLGSSAGEQGVLPPWLGAWFANVIFFVLAAWRLILVVRR